MSSVALRDGLTRLVEPIVRSAGLDLEGVEIRPAGRRRVVRIIVDKDGGVGPDELAQVSTAISGRLDDSDLLGASAYVLEVSSPGVDRPLTAARHWRRARGRLVRATMTVGGELSGRVVDSDEAAATLEINGQHRFLSYDEIANARVVVEFNRPAPTEPNEEV